MCETFYNESFPLLFFFFNPSNESFLVVVRNNWALQFEQNIIYINLDFLKLLRTLNCAFCDTTIYLLQ